MISVRIFSLFGTHTQLLYHNRLSLHWHSPSATPCNSLWFICNAYRISWNWLSSSLAFSSSSVFFSLIWCVSVVLSCMAVLQYYSLGRRVIFLCVLLASLGVGMSRDLRMRASGFPPSNPGLYSILMSKLANSSLHRICLPLSSFVAVKGTRFLWSVRILTVYAVPSQYCLHSPNACMIANSSLSWIS